MEDVPDLPNFSKFHDAFRDKQKAPRRKATCRCLYLAYDAANCEHVKLASKEVDQRLRADRTVSANSSSHIRRLSDHGPGQVITKEIITFMRKLD